MASTTRAQMISIIIRVLLFIFVFLIGIFTAGYFELFNRLVLDYRFSDLLESYGAILNGLVLSWVFWSSITFGCLGKKFDYYLIVILFLSAGTVYWGSGPKMYLGLIGIVLISNTIGYLLKLARMRWIEQKNPGRGI